MAYEILLCYDCKHVQLIKSASAIPKCSRGQGVIKLFCFIIMYLSSTQAREQVVKIRHSNIRGESILSSFNASSRFQYAWGHKPQTEAKQIGLIMKSPQNYQNKRDTLYLTKSNFMKLKNAAEGCNEVMAKIQGQLHEIFVEIC